MFSVEAFLGVTGVTALAFVLWLPDRLEKRRAQALLYDLPPEARVADLLQAWSRQRRVPIFFDPAVTDRTIRFAACEAALDWETTLQILNLNDVLVEERVVKGQRVAFAHVRRNCGTLTVPPGWTFPQERRVVTAVFKIRSGAGNDIFSTIRGFVVRDKNRLGQILYVRGPEILVVVDYAENVEWYRKAVGALDAPGVGDATRVVQVEAAKAAEVARRIEDRFRWRSPSCRPRVVIEDREDKLMIVARDDDAREIDAILALSPGRR